MIRRIHTESSIPKATSNFTVLSEGAAALNTVSALNSVQKG